MGYVEDAEPVVVYHDLNGPLQSKFYELLGEFITKYTAAEEDIIRATRAFLSVAASGDLRPLPVIHIVTAAAPVGALMDISLVVAEEIRQFTDVEISRLKKAASQFEIYKGLRNLLAHQAANISPYTELPFAINKTTSEKRQKDFRTIYIGTEALEAAIHDAPLAGYHYRLALGRADVPADKSPTWQYTSSLLVPRHHRPR